MDILHIIPDNEVGGGSNFVVRLIEELKQYDDADNLIMLPSDSTKRLIETVSRCRYIFGKYPGRGNVIKLARAIARSVKSGDIVHAHGTRAALAAVLSRVVFGTRNRIVYTVHGYHGLSRPDRFGLRVKIEQLLASRVDLQTFVSESDRRLAVRKQVNAGRTEVIYTGVRVAAEGASRPRETDVLWVGRFVYQKNPEALIELAQKLPSNVTIAMVGSGEKFLECQKLAVSERVKIEFLGEQSPEETLNLMGRAKVLILTSRWEGLPTVAIEGILKGCVVIGFKIDPLKEILYDSSDVALFGVAEGDEMVKTIADILKDYNRRIELSARQQAYVLRTFSPDLMAAKYIEAYRSVQGG